MKHNDNSDSRTRAIQTRYEGYHFRSRLEARYAVFFDAIGADWDYELEGFDLGELGRYLPDFFIHSPYADGSRGFWVEIKPESDADCWKPTEPEEKLELLAELTGCECVLLCGVPDMDATKTSVFIPCGICGRRWTRGTGVYAAVCDFIKAQANEVRLIDEACESAKSARFEYGENPRAQR